MKRNEFVERIGTTIMAVLFATLCYSGAKQVERNHSPEAPISFVTMNGEIIGTEFELDDPENVIVDLALTTELQFLNGLNDIKTITIKNAQFLTKEQALTIHELQEKDIDITLEYDIVELSQTCKTCPLIESNYHIIFERPEAIQNSEFVSYMTYKYFEGYPIDNEYYDQIDPEEIQELDDKIATLISKLDIDETQSPLVQIAELSKELCKYMVYDERVEEKDSETGKYTEVSTEIVHYYNTKSLTSVLDGLIEVADKKSGEVKGICCNYSDVFFVVATMLANNAPEYFETYGLSCVTSDGEGHALNAVKVNGECIYIDITSTDSEGLNEIKCVTKDENENIIETHYESRTDEEMIDILRGISDYLATEYDYGNQVTCMINGESTLGGDVSIPQKTGDVIPVIISIFGFGIIFYADKKLTDYLEKPYGKKEEL